jgi:hypothetical protein
MSSFCCSKEFGLGVAFMVRTSASIYMYCANAKKQCYCFEGGSMLASGSTDSMWILKNSIFELNFCEFDTS